MEYFSQPFSQKWDFAEKENEENLDHHQKNQEEGLQIIGNEVGRQTERAEPGEPVLRLFQKLPPVDLRKVKLVLQTWDICLGPLD